MRINFEAIRNFFLSQRRSGTTTLIEKVSKENDVFVLTMTMVEARRFGGNGISVNEISSTSGNELEKRPILVDNHTMISLMQAAEMQQKKLDTINELYKKFKHDVDLVLKSDF